MASKLETSTQQAKKLGIGCLIVIAVVIIFNLVSRLFVEPEPDWYPYPTVADEDFSEILPLEFSSLALSEDSEPEYTIETTDGNLPTILAIANTYRTKTPYQSLTANDEAIEKANALGFKEDPKVLSTTELQWSKGAKTLDINKLYNTVSLETRYDKDAEALGYHEILPDPEPYIGTARNILGGAGLFPQEFEDMGRSTVTYLKLNSSYKFEKAKSASDANFVRVDFFKELESVGVLYPENVSDKLIEEIDEMRIYSEVLTDNPNEGLLYVILSGTSGTQDLHELKFTEWELEENSTYNLITVDDAWEKVRNNEGYLVSLYEDTESPFKEYSAKRVNSFLLTNVELAYYSAKEYIQYIQPIYKFTGIAKMDDDQDANFTFYFPAIKPSE